MIVGAARTSVMTRGGTAVAVPPRTIAVSSFAPALVVRGDVQPAAGPARRTKIWEFNTNLHCSIVGTCLSTGELRQVLKKLGVAAPDSTDHELHGAAVSLAGRHDKAAKLLHKALDERHRVAINQFAKATTEDARSLAVARRSAAWRDTRRLLGDPDASGHDAGDHSRRVRRGAHAVASRRCGQSRRYPPAV